MSAARGTDARYERPGLNADVLARFFSLAKPFWQRIESVKYWFGLAFVIGASSWSAIGQGWLTFVQRDMLNALNAREEHTYLSAIALNAALVLIGGIIASTSGYLQGRIGLSWRQALTRQMQDLYFGHRTYYAIQQTKAIDNPDERIAEDIRLFTTQTGIILSLVISFVSGILVFVPIAWRGVGAWSLLLIVYGVVGTLIFTKFFGILAALNAAKLRIEADFRFELVRVRDNAESIAFYRGENVERESLKQRFARVIDNTLRILWKTAQYQTGQILYSLVLSIGPLAFLASRYFDHQIDLGTIWQVSGAVGAVAATVTFFVTYFDKITLWGAEVNRLYDLREALQAHARAGEPHIEAGGELSAKSVSVAVPGGDRTLVENLDIGIPANASIVITGPSGAGKSSLLRVLAGLWRARTGRIALPDRVMFLPQRPYMPLGDLRTAIAYPNDPLSIGDERYAQLLRTVGLPDLIERTGGLSAERDWSRELSQGEQQCIAFARVLAAAPDLVLLDEASSALDPEKEERLYSLLRDSGTTIVSVGHRESIVKYHDWHLELGLPNAGWHLMPIVEPHGAVASVGL